MSNYTHYLFSRGFLLTSQEVPKSLLEQRASVILPWQRLSLKNACLLYHASQTVHHLVNGAGEVVLIGHSYNPWKNTADTPAILADLLEYFLTDRTAFYKALDDLSGRFVLYLDNGREQILLQDATGTQAVYYSQSGEDFYIASHTQLLADLLDRNVTSEVSQLTSSSYFKQSIRVLPGVRTPFTGITALLPNTLLRLPNLKLERFFPREPLSLQKDLTVVANDVAKVMRNSTQLLVTRQPLAVSVTAGMDSRITLAASLAIADADTPLCYTYVVEGDRKHVKDAEAAQQFCQHLNLQHQTYRVPFGSDTAVPHDFLDVWQHSTAHLRSPSYGAIAWILLNQYPADHLHLKSTVSEVGRAFYQKNLDVAPQQLSPRILGNLYHRYRKADAFIKDYVHSAFEEFCGLRDFNRSAMLNYSFYDLFYWEHRSGAWQALTLQDWDAAQNTSILYNNRRLLQQLLSVPLEHRAKDTVHSLILKQLWSEVLEPTSMLYPTPSRKNQMNSVRRRFSTLTNNLKRSMFLRYN